MGLEQGRFLSEKIFNLMESEQRGTADLDGFIQYMLIYSEGNEVDKAVLSFYFLD